MYIGHGLLELRKESNFFNLLSYYFFSFSISVTALLITLLFTYYPIQSSTILYSFSFNFLHFTSSRKKTFFSLLLLVFGSFILCYVPPLSCLLRSCMGFHSVLSSFQPSFVKERKMREISIALLLFQEGYSIQVCFAGCPFGVWLLIFQSFSLFLWWRVWLGSRTTYNCLTQVWAFFAVWSSCAFIQELSGLPLSLRRCFQSSCFSPPPAT